MREERLEYRQQIHVLLAQQPNYFGNMPELGIPPVVEIVADTFFEEATCVAFNPDTDILEATVEVKRSNGYGGDPCGPGSTEWVRFYLSYDDGATWEDVGLSSFNAHDIPDSTDCAQKPDKPLTYCVAHPLADPQRKRCTTAALPLARAILSWQIMPPAGQPGWSPVWGNTLDHHIQLRPRSLFFRDLIDILGVKKLPLEFEQLLPVPLPPVPPSPLSPFDLSHDDVPPHRFAASLIAEATTPKALSQTNILSTMNQFEKASVDWSKAIDAYFGESGDTTYERLDCLGLDPNRDLLVATFSIRQPLGFSTSLCGPGSTEHVAFWVDYDNTCRWTYAGTAKLHVYNFNPLPRDGVHYWVAVPARLAEHFRGCQEPRAARIRAVLSWSTPPSVSDPYDMPRWGNAIETHVEVVARRPVSDGPEIDIIGGIPIAQIDTAGSGLTWPGALFAQWGSPADPWLGVRRCPFGGTVTVNADVPVSHSATGRRYRLLWRPAGSASTGNPVTDPFVTSDGLTVTTRYPDPVTGRIPYLAPSQNVFNVLGSWRTRGVVTDGRYEIRLEMSDAGGSVLGSTGWFTVLVDNTAPHAELTLTSGTPCNRANPGDTVSGTFEATDLHFGAFALDTLPASLSPPAPDPTPSVTTSPVPSGTWELPTTTDWTQCGYVVRLHVWDRAVVDSIPNAHNYGYDDVGFCLGL
jgi:hypothetical protein